MEVATYDQYRWAVARHIVPLIGAVRFGDMTPEVVDDWLRELSAAPEGGRPRLGSTSSRLVRKMLSMALEEAVQRGRLARNPVVLTQASERIVTFGPATTDVLRRHRARQLSEASVCGRAWVDSGLVFTTGFGGQIDPNNFGRLMDDLIAKSGLPRITPKGCGTQPSRVGRVVVGDDKVMQERLGHADVDITLNTYTYTVSQFDILVLMTAGAIRGAGLELRPTFRRPHYTIMLPNLDRDIDRLIQCDNVRRTNPHDGRSEEER